MINVLLKTKYDTNINQQSDNDVTALMIAANNNHEEAVTALLDFNPDVNLENSYGNTAMVLAEKQTIID